MSNKIVNLLEELKNLTLLEASDLVQKIEETFDVDTSIGGGVMMMSTGSSEQSAEVTAEKDEFDIILEQVPADKKIAILKVVRTVTGLGLKEAKELVDLAPKAIKEALPKDAAEEAKKQLEEAGAVVSLK